jgi:hypothetical protein
MTVIQVEEVAIVMVGEEVAALEVDLVDLTQPQ